MSFLDDLGNDPATPLFEPVDDQELARQDDQVKKLGQKILSEEAVTGQRSEERDAAMFKAVDPYEYLVSRGKTAVDISRMNPKFVGKLASAIQEAEAATGERARLTSGYRDTEEQARLYERYLNGEGGLAAPPGHSRHERGNAADLSYGKVLSWLHSNRGNIRDKYGIDFLTGPAFNRDKVHIQLVDQNRDGVPDQLANVQNNGSIPAPQDYVSHTQEGPNWPPVQMDQGQSGKTVGELSTQELLAALQQAQASDTPDVSQMYLNGKPPEPAPEKTLWQKITEGLFDARQGLYNTPVDRAMRRYGGSLLGGVTSLPFTLGKGLAAGPALVEKGLFGTDGWMKQIEALDNSASQAQGASDFLTGAEPAQGPVEQFMDFAGRAGPMPAKAAMSIAGGMQGLQNIMAPADAAKMPASGVNEKIDTTIETIGGPQKFKSSDYNTLGGLVLTSAGAIFAPMLYTKFKTGIVPKVQSWAGWGQGRAVTDAAPGTMAYSRNSDLARTADDANAGVLRIAGTYANPTAYAEVEKNFNIQTRASANALSDAAINLGEMHTPNFTFKSKVPLTELAQADSPEVRQYLTLRHMADELLIRGTQQGQISAARQAAQGPPSINGMTLPTVFQQMHALEQANPQLTQVAMSYNDVLRSMRKFENTGEFATLSKTEFRRLNQERSNTIPFKESENPYDGTSSPFQSLANEMSDRLRQRMENEARGTYVDAMRQAKPDSFVRVGPSEIKDNPQYKKNLVTVYRRGKPEYYTTDPFVADMLKFDPQYTPSVAKGALAVTKDWFQKTTTGVLAPWFAWTSMDRAWQQSKFTTGYDVKSPGIASSMAAIPQQLYPQMAKFITDRLETGSLGWLSQTFPSGITNSLAMRMAKGYDDALTAMQQHAKNSLYYRMQPYGSFEGSQFMQDTLSQSAAQNAYTAAMQKINQVAPSVGPYADAMAGMGRVISQSMRGGIDSYKAFLNSIHNAPMYAFAKKNEAVVGDLSQLSMLSRDLTGNPRVGGQFYVGQKGETPSPIRMEDTNPVGKFAASQYGRAMELGREALPWFNIIQQSIKKTGERYLDNPAKFVGRTWLYSITPAAAEYFYARGLGNDPNGNSYVDYMMNRRSDQDRMLNWYIPVPGRPAEQGIKVPTFQEMSIVRYLTHTALDHLSGSSVFSEGQDMMRAAKAFMGITVTPPMAPAGNLLLAGQGMEPQFGMFGEQSYTRKQDPFDQTGGMPHSIELLVRALAPGIADVAGAGAAAWMQTPNSDGTMKAWSNAFKDSGKKVVEKTATLRDIAGLSPPASGVNAISEELFKKQKSISNLLDYMKKIDGANPDGTPRIGSTIGKKSGESATGEAVATGLLGPSLSRQSVGMEQPAPTNPLFVMFGQDAYEKFKKDALVDKHGADAPGIGYRSIWKRYSDATSQIRTMRNINSGNYGTWQKYLQTKPDIMDELRRNKVNYKDPTLVRNFYEAQRTDAAKVLLNVIGSVERDFSQRLGRPLKIEQLDPYGKGLDQTDYSGGPDDEH